MHKNKDKEGYPKFEADSMHEETMQVSKKASKQPTKITEEPGSNTGSPREENESGNMINDLWGIDVKYWRTCKRFKEIFLVSDRSFTANL